jgi:hypothetical protein
VQRKALLSRRKQQWVLCSRRFARPAAAAGSPHCSSVCRSRAAAAVWQSSSNPQQHMRTQCSSSRRSQRVKQQQHMPQQVQLSHQQVGSHGKQGGPPATRGRRRAGHRGGVMHHPPQPGNPGHVATPAQAGGALASRALCKPGQTQTTGGWSTGASSHMCRDKSQFTQYAACQGSWSHDGNSSASEAAHNEKRTKDTDTFLSRYTP